MKALRQAWTLMRHNPLFSSIYIAGTALSVCMVMIVALYFHIQIGNVYPERHRDRQLYLQYMQLTSKDTTQYKALTGAFGPEFVRQVCSSLESAEAVSTHLRIRVRVQITTDKVQQPLEVETDWVDDGYWSMYSFEVLSGRVFTKEEFASGMCSAVISESLGRVLFGDEEPVGRSFREATTNQTYTVVGVVRNVSRFIKTTYAHLWVPYTSYPELDELTDSDTPLLGSMSIALRPTKEAGREGLTQEIERRVRDLEQSINYRIDLKGSPMSPSEQLFSFGWNLGEDNDGALYAWLLLLTFLLVPALNLSALNSSMMERRLSEIGVRKAFGASNIRLMGQVMLENLVYTAIGALVGLLVAYAVVLLSGEVLLESNFSRLTTSAVEELEMGFTWDMLVNVPIFLTTLLVAFVLNTLASFAPILGVLRRDVVSTLHDAVGDKK